MIGALSLKLTRRCP